MATYKETADKIGKKGYIYAGGLQVEVEICDYKRSYGNDRWLVKPVAGKGTVWVETVEVDGEEV